jgi:ABC-type transport system substrate-binding protein
MGRKACNFSRYSPCDRHYQVAIKDPTGSGPFKMVLSEWQPGYKVLFARNPDYVPLGEPSNDLRR